jgi:hypothetical protein
VPSHFVRHCFIQGGVPEAKVHVVPLGVAELFFREDVDLHFLTNRWH